jgi:REP element-mobilizing transposase RayT
MKRLPVRKRLRLRAYDYSRPGAYFVTIVTRNRRPILGAVTRNGIRLTDAGRIVHETWLLVPERFRGVYVDAFVVMPDHVHAVIIRLQNDTPAASISQIVGWTKQRATRAIAALASPCRRPVWHTSFHDRIIHDQAALTRARNYVIANPARAWYDLRRASRSGSRTAPRRGGNRAQVLSSGARGARAS